METDGRSTELGLMSPLLATLKGGTTFLKCNTRFPVQGPPFSRNKVIAPFLHLARLFSNMSAKPRSDTEVERYEKTEEESPNTVDGDEDEEVPEIRSVDLDDISPRY